MEGLRVVRGPDWRWGNQDGGKGFVGTVIHQKPLESGSLSSVVASLGARQDEELWARVVWDCGIVGNYRIGCEGAFDLRVVDNAATGVSHQVRCEGCFKGIHIAGIRWVCDDCNRNMCSSCYYGNSHNTRHTRFQRFDTPASEPVTVFRGKPADKVQLKGIFRGAMVKRGFHWESGNEDVEENDSGVGTAKCWHSLNPGWVHVKWLTDKCFPYRLGASGKVDLSLVKHATGGHYIPENLPVLKAKRANKLSAGSDRVDFAIGDRVRVAVRDPDQLERLQHGHGGWVADMAKIDGEEGKVTDVCEVGVLVSFPHSRPFTLNPAALERTAPFSVGQMVRVNNDPDTAQSMIEHQLSDDAIVKIAGETGRIVDCPSEGEVIVAIDGLDRKEAGHKLRPCWLDAVPVKDSIKRKLAKLDAEWTELFVDAAAEGQLPVLKHLVSVRGVSVDGKVAKGRTALHLASRRGQLSVVKWLVETQGAVIHAKDGKLRSAIHYAAKGAESPVLELLVSCGARLDDKDVKSWTPLQLAARASCTACMAVLVGHGCDVNGQDAGGNTPLYNAIVSEVAGCGYRNHETVDYLLTKSDLTIANRESLNALMLAAAVKNRRVVEVILKEHGKSLAGVQSASDGYTALHIACRIGDVQGVILIVQHATEWRGSDSLFEIRCKNGFTPLLVAADHAHFDIVGYLVHVAHADVTAKTNDGHSAVHLMAAKIGSLPVKDVPREWASREVDAIHHKLLYTHPFAMERYPQLAVVCFLVQKGCPWRRPANRQASVWISEPLVRKTLLAYCADACDPEADEAGSDTIACILCANWQARPGVVPGCDHVCASVCVACVARLTVCLVCKAPNGTFGKSVAPPVLSVERDGTATLAPSASSATLHATEPLPTEDVEKRNSITTTGKPILLYNGYKFSLQKSRGQHIKVYRCAQMQPQAKKKCPAIIEEVYNPVTNHVEAYYKGQASHKHAPAKRPRRELDSIALPYSPNILVADDNVVKISDLGFASKSRRKLDLRNKSAASDAPSYVKRMAIESIKDPSFSCKTDV